MKIQNWRTFSNPVLVLALLTAWTMLRPSPSVAEGTWVPLANPAPGGIGLMLLLSDGTVMCQNWICQSNAWYRLTPDEHGSYVNGTWTTLSNSVYGHALLASQLLTDGRVFIAGGEYCDGATAEVYDPVTGSWSAVNPPLSLLNPNNSSACGGLQNFSDMISETLPNGSVLMAPVNPMNAGDTLIYNGKSNIWSFGGKLTNAVCDQDESSWVKLPDGSILTIDPNSETSQRYIPSATGGQGMWIPDNNVPVFLWNNVGDGYEIGPAVMLPNGKALFVGGTGANALYKPSGNASPGTWTVGPTTPDGYESADAPGAMLVNGKYLLALATNCFNGGCDPPWVFYEYDYSSGANGSFITAPAPVGFPSSGLFIPLMLDLPDGTVLLSGNTSQLYDYQPVGGPLAAWQPGITSITLNADGSFHLVGTNLNGISAGANEGDDAQMDSNYPLVRMTNQSSGLVYYARTHNWSSTGIQTGTTPESTEFTAPQYLPPGNYSLVVVANGIASNPVTFGGPVWVDFNYINSSGIYLGTFEDPYQTLAQGVTGVVTGGNLFINASLQPSVSHEKLTISKPMNLVSVGGASTIGH